MELTTLRHWLYTLMRVRAERILPMTDAVRKPRIGRSNTQY